MEDGEQDVALSVRGLTHRFRSRVALSNVNLSVSRGQIVALLGPNGSGKTTLLRILATLILPDEGHARIFGVDIAADPAAVRRMIGVTFQSPSLDRKLTVRENMLHHGHLYGLRGGDLAQRIRTAADMLEVGDRLGDRVETLSGGLARRVEIAKCMMHEPRLLLMDEPSTGLDPTARRTMRERIEQLRSQRGVTCLLTTHLMEEADACDRVAILDQGRLVAYDTPCELKESVGGDVVTLQVEGGDPVVTSVERHLGAGVRRLGETLRIEHPQGHELAATLARTFGSSITSLTVGKPTLDDVFARLTGRRLDQQ